MTEQNIRNNIQELYKHKSRRDFLKIGGLGFAGLMFPSLHKLKAAAGNKRPNILFIYSDDHGYQAISAYNGILAKAAPTPNLDRIAKEGMIFNKSYVTNSICAPCRAVIQTGKYSHINGVITNGEKFDGAQQTMPKLMKKAGYQTALIGKWHLQSRPTGFDYDEVLPGQGDYYNPVFIKRGKKITYNGYNTDITTDLCLNWLEKERDKSKPFMMMLQFKAPHRAWMPALRHLTLFKDMTMPEPENLFDDYSGRGTAAHTQDMSIEKTMNENDLKLTVHPNEKMDPEQKKAWDAVYSPENEAFKKADLKGKELVRWKYQRYIKDYLRCIKAIDENVGRVLEYLERSGLADNTVVFYSSDQGFYLGEHGWFDKRFMYEESFRTPLLIKWPGKIKPGSINNDMVQNLDIAETILDIAGENPPSDMQGTSFKPILLGQKPADWRKSLYYHYYEFPAVHSVRRHEGVMTERYKLIHFYDINEWEFYDLEKDKHEMKSEYDNSEYSEKIKELKSELERLKVYYKVPPPPPLKEKKQLKKEE